MSGSVLLFLLMRVLHVVLAAAWFGAAAFMVLYLGPTVDQLGAPGGAVMNALTKRGMHSYMASIAGLTVVTGIYLFWHFTGGFDPAISAGRAGMAYSIGGLAGFIALMLGGMMISRNVKKMAALGEQMAATTDGAQRAAMMTTMGELRGTIQTFSRVVVVLLLIALTAMALGHYI